MKFFFVLAGLLCFATIHSQSLHIVRNSKGLYGYVNEKNDTVVKPMYAAKPGEFAYGVAIVKVAGNKFAVIDNKGNKLTEKTYDAIDPFAYGLAKVKMTATDTTKKTTSTYPQQAQNTSITYYGMINTSGKEVIPVKYESITGDFSNGWFVKGSIKNKKDKYLTMTGDSIAIPANSFLSMDKIDGTKFIAYSKGGYGVIDNKWKELLPFEHSSLRAGTNGLIIATKNNKVGLIDPKTMKWIVSPTYKTMYPFVNGYAIVQDTTGKYGAINEKGIVTTAMQFANLTAIDKASLPFAYTENNGISKAALVNLATGKTIVPFTYFFKSYDYYNGFIQIREENKKGLIDSTGKVLFTPGTYKDFSLGFADGLAWVNNDGKYGFINQKGMLVIPMQYQSVRGFTEGVAVVQKDNKYGMINKKGDIILPTEYDNIFSFTEGLVLVKKDNLFGYADTKGKLVIPLQFTYGSVFDAGLAFVQKDGKYFYINKTGNIIP